MNGSQNTLTHRSNKLPDTTEKNIKCVNKCQDHDSGESAKSNNNECCNYSDSLIHENDRDLRINDPLYGLREAMHIVRRHPFYNLWSYIL